MPFEKILCPVDFSETSEIALDYALAIARTREAEVSVLHVLPEVLAAPDVYPYLSAPVLLTDEMRERAYEQLGRFVHRALERGVSAEVLLEEGDVVEATLDTAKRLSSDLVVMGTHGRKGFSRMLLGSVTEKLLRRSEVPVLSVGARAPGPHVDEGPTFRRILCPVDFSDSSLRGLEIARGLAGRPEELTVLHVVELYLDAVAADAVAFDLAELEERHREQAEQKLEQILPGELRKGVRLETAVLRSGGPYKEILRRVEENEHDLVVMGVFGRSAADMLFFGSTTNHVVRAAACPVLTVRSPGEAE